MLGELLAELNNWFEIDIHTGRFSISGGNLPAYILETMYAGQRFRIIGSAMNDGVYTWGGTSVLDDDGVFSADLHDETFGGEGEKAAGIWVMNVPKAVLDTAKEIADWKDKYGAQMLSPYASESFKGYSYTKATGGTGGGGGSADAWKSVFADRLRRWRKL